jgi:uncharacterized damage-inducible protein DinB
LLLEAVHALYDYSSWANHRLFEAAERMSDDGVTQVAVGHERSLLAILVHILDAHRGWLSWWDGSAATVEARELLRYDVADFADVRAVRDAWRPIEDQTARFLAGLTEDGLAAVYERALRNGTAFRQPLWAMMLHVANHGTQHRSEAAAMVTAAGQSPGELDFVFYMAGR